MNIEISDKKYWKMLNYYDGLLYLSLLNIDGKNDWRMIKNTVEWYNNDFDKLPNTAKWYASRWYCEDIEDANDRFLKNQTYMVIPVRDI